LRGPATPRGAIKTALQPAGRGTIGRIERRQRRTQAIRALMDRSHFRHGGDSGSGQARTASPARKRGIQQCAIGHRFAGPVSGANI
jgi:hypothetical protein